jgi:hypothetical protein
MKGACDLYAAPNTSLHRSASRVHMKTKLIIFGGVLFIAMAFANAPPKLSHEARSTEFETRCGWFSNPTPANAWLQDRYGEWIIGVQGGHRAEGDWPTFKARQWVRTNGNYGYGCACMQIRVDKQTHEVLEIKSSHARMLAQCRQDPALKKWKHR